MSGATDARTAGSCREPPSAREWSSCCFPPLRMNCLMTLIYQKAEFAVKRFSHNKKEPGARIAHLPACRIYLSHRDPVRAQCEILRCTWLVRSFRPDGAPERVRQSDGVPRLDWPRLRRTGGIKRHTIPLAWRLFTGRPSKSSYGPPPQRSPVRWFR